MERALERRVWSSGAWILLFTEKAPAPRCAFCQWPELSCGCNRDVSPSRYVSVVLTWHGCAEISVITALEMSSSSDYSFLYFIKSISQEAFILNSDFQDNHKGTVTGREWGPAVESHWLLNYIQKSWAQSFQDLLLTQLFRWPRAHVNDQVIFPLGDSTRTCPDPN